MIDFGSKNNIIHLIFAKKLGFIIRKTNISTWKINDYVLKTYIIIKTSFLLNNEASKTHFFKEIFLLIENSIIIILGIISLALSKANVNFANKKLKKWYLYIFVKIIPIITKAKLIKKKKFVVITLFFSFNSNIYLFYRI